MPSITITISPPAGGKTTWAKAQVKKNGNTILVCRDDFRDQLFGGLVDYKYTDKKEKLVTDSQKATILAALAAGQNVIVADTHCKASSITAWRQFARENTATLVVKDLVAEYLQENADAVVAKGLDSVLDQYRARCHKWNLQRANSVPPEVIDRMLNNYLTDIMKLKVRQHVKVPGLPNAVIFDVDGTLAHMLNLRGPFDWHKVGVDHVDPVVVEVLKMYKAAGYIIIIMSGRDGVCKPETCDWFMENQIPFDHLFMRAAGDQRNDAVVKEELFFNHVEGNFNIQVVLDDRNRVVDKWRAMGLKVFQVADGNF